MTQHPGEGALRRALSAAEIIELGRQNETRRYWERVRAFTVALYGPAAQRVAFSQLTLPLEDHQQRAIQLIVTDAAGTLLPYDFTTLWWQGQELPDELRAFAYETSVDEIERGLGSSFEEPVRGALRAFGEQALGIELLHRWERDATLTWMFDLAAPPPLLYSSVEAGEAELDADALIQLGREHAAYERWRGVREYTRLLYGEASASVNVIYFSLYNDYTYDRDVALEVFDRTGKQVYYDLGLPWWEQFHLTPWHKERYLEQHQEQERFDGETDPAFDWDVLFYGPDRTIRSQIQRLAMTLLGAEFIETREEWDRDVVTYDLTRARLPGYAEVWARVGAIGSGDQSAER